MSIFKVFYQEDRSEVIIRENTKVKYVEAETEEQVRKYLADRPFNIEFVQKLDDAHLAYEEQSANYEVESI